MERYSASTIYLLASAVCGLITEAVAGDLCKQAVIRERRSQANLSRPGEFLAWRRSQDWNYFECDNGCCGETAQQYCCPDEEDEEGNSVGPGMVTAVSVSIFLVILAVVLIGVGCLCYRTRQKRSQRGRRRRPPPPPTVSTTLSSATLPPSYEMSTTVPEAPPSNAGAPELELPPPYEEAIAQSTPSAPPLPSRGSRVITTVTRMPSAFARSPEQ